jgi:flagellar hook-associated protein 1 FlgK
MSGTFFGLEIARRGLMAQQAALNTTGHNIANQGTEGYTRQRVNMSATAAIPYPSLVNSPSYGQVGTGVEITTVERMRDQFMDTRFRENNSELGEWDTKAGMLSQIEMFMKEPSDSGLQKVLGDFWQSWQTVANNPTSKESRAVVLERANALVDAIHSTYQSLSQLKQDIDGNPGQNIKGDLDIKVGQINDIADSIAELNKQINELKSLNYSPNDLMDKRDLLVDQLSKMADITVSPIMNGSVDTGMISIKINDMTPGNSQYLIDNINGQNQGISLSGTDVQVGGVTVQVNSGELKGLADSSKTITDYMDKLDAFVYNLADSINTIHKNGADFNGNDGVDFFSYSSAIPSPPTGAAASIQVNITDPLEIAASTKSGSISDNNGENATNIANKLMSLNGDYYSIIGDLGVKSSDAQRRKGNADNITGSIDQFRASVSQVSLDEEMTNIIKYQQAYNAAARTITAVDEMLDKIINSMGLVGR